MKQEIKLSYRKWTGNGEKQAYLTHIYINLVWLQNDNVNWMSSIAHEICHFHIVSTLKNPIRKAIIDKLHFIPLHFKSI